MLLAMGGLMGVTLKAPPALAVQPGANAATLDKLRDTVGRITPAQPIDAAQQDAASKLIEWLQADDSGGADLRRHDLHDIASLLGRRFDDLPDAEAALEAHVLAAGPEHDIALLQLFAALEGRRLQLFGPTRIGHSAQHVRLLHIR